MKCKLIRSSILLTVIFIFGILTLTAVAADDESVLTTIGHTDTNTVNLTEDERSVTLKVPFAYSDDIVDLLNGIIIDYNTSKYEYAIAEPDSEAIVDGDYVSVPVIYKKTDESEAGTTTYNVKVVRTPAKAPSFSGTISKIETSSHIVAFSKSDFTSKYSKNDGEAIGHISIKGSNPDFGTLTLSNNTYSFGDLISVSDLSKLNFEATGTGTVSYAVKAYAESDSENAIGNVVLTIEVITEPTIKSDITQSVSVGSTIIFSLSDFRSHYNLNEGALKTIEITPDNAGCGTWYSGSTSFSGSKAFTSSSISKLKFTGSTVGTESFSWRVSNEAGYSENGGGKITINPIPVPTIKSSISQIVSSGSTLVFSLSDFSRSYNLNDGTLNDIEITPSNTSYGTWYAGSKAFTEPQTFTSSNIDNLKFTGGVPGTATFNWRVSNETGYSESGTGKITVSSALTLLPYTTSSSVAKDSTWTVSSSHFDYTPTANDITYVKITGVPKSKSGYLYLTTALSADSTKGYSAVGSNTALKKNTVIPYSYLKYLRIKTESNNSDTDISFSWTATTDDNVKSAVWAAETTYTVDFATAGTVIYMTEMDTPIMLDGTDFNKAFLGETGISLSYVKFTPPSDSHGKMYYNYSSESEDNTEISSSTKYYRSATPYLSDITFVPSSNYTGTVNIEYTGYTSDDVSYTGTLRITIGNSEAGIITYTTDDDSYIKLDSSDFRTAFKDATGYTLSYVKFKLPSAACGTLYYDYKSSSRYDSEISANTKYYRSSSPSLSKVAFVPNKNYSGTVNINYTGYTSDGDSYTGIMRIIVSDSDPGIVSYETDKDKPVTLKASDFNTAFRNESGETLYYVKFKLPSSSQGKLYYNYKSASKYDSTVSSSTRYYRSSSRYLSNVTFVPKSGYTGTVNINYTGYTSDGDSYTGTLKIIVGDIEIDTITYVTTSNTPITFNASDFSDAFIDSTGLSLSYVKFKLPLASYGKLYYDYDSASNYDSTVSTNTKYYSRSSPNLSDVTFVPNTSYNSNSTINISYTGYASNGTSFTGELEIITGIPSHKSRYFSDVGTSYSWAIEPIDYLYEKSVVSGIGTNNYNPAANMTRGDFMLILCRAFNLNEKTNDNFSDVAKNSYYYDAIATAKVLGIAQGDGINFHPDSSITRQDAMVLVSRTLDICDINIVPGSSGDLTGFIDSKEIPNYAVNAVSSLVKAEIIKGTESYLNPSSNVTRAEMAVIVYRILTR